MLIFVFALAFIFVPAAEAASLQSSRSGFFSFIKSALGFKNPVVADSGKETTPAQRTQNIAFLKAALSADPLTGQGGAEINIIEDNTLMPYLGPESTLVENINQNQSDQISIYVVREGDNLSKIADLFNVSINTIFWSNNLTKKDHILPGQILVILPTSGVKYEVQKGDTVEKIALKFGGDAEEIIAFNNLPLGGELKTGETIIIPDGELPYIPESGPSGTALRASGPDYGGYYLRPISGGRKSQGLHGFNGVDLATYCGEPVFASASGDVIVAQNYGWNGGYGKYLAINHPNSTQTLYAHLNSIIVSQGWHIVQGQIIGYIGSSGKSTGCHLHFEARGAKNPF